MKNLLLATSLALSVLLTGCELKFGDDIELSGADFDATTLAQVSSLTGVVFPAGTRGC